MNDFIKIAEDTVVCAAAITHVSRETHKLAVGTSQREYIVHFDTEHDAITAFNNIINYLNIVEEL